MINTLKIINLTLIKNNKKILNNLNWTVKKGEHWALIGKNGSGKTMLMNVIAGYIYPTNGVVELLEERRGETDIRLLRKKIGLVSYDLISKLDQKLTVYQVVISGYHAAFGIYEKVPKEAEKEAKKLIAYLDLNDKTNQSFSSLSSGEQKRALIARSLIRKPSALLLDEPAANLDMRSKKIFLEYINKIMSMNKELSIILTTHHIDEIVPAISHIIFLKDGKVVKKGTKEKMLNSDNFSEVLDIELNIKQKAGWYFGHFAN